MGINWVPWQYFLGQLVCNSQESKFDLGNSLLPGDSVDSHRFKFDLGNKIRILSWKVLSSNKNNRDWSRILIFCCPNWGIGSKWSSSIMERKTMVIWKYFEDFLWFCIKIDLKIAIFSKNLNFSRFRTNFVPNFKFKSPSNYQTL